MTVGELFVIFGLKPQGWEKGNALVQGLASAARRYLGVEAVKSIFSFVEHATEAATHLVSFSNAMGLSVEQTQEWGYVAEQSGSNLKELAVGFGMFEKNLRNFSQGRGGKSLQATMAELGISAADAKKAIESPDGFNALLLKTSDRFKDMGNNAHRGALGMAAFGARAGRAVVADMARGSQAIDELMARRRAMGELDEQQAHNLRDLGNHIQDVKKSFSAMGMTILAQLAPQMLAMADAAVKWVQANKDIISGALAAALKVVLVAFEGIGAVISAITDLIRSAMGGDDGAQAILIGLAVAIGTIVVPALWAMAAPVIAVMLPFLAIAAVVALIAYGILKLIKYAPQIKQALGDAWDWVKQKAIDFWEWLSGLPGRLVDMLEDVGHKIIDAFKTAWEAVKEATADAVEWIGQKVEEVPLFGLLPLAARKLGEGAAFLSGARQAGPEDLTGIDSINGVNNPYANVKPGSGGVGNATGVNVNAPMNVTINGVKDAPQAVQEIQGVVENQLRHAMADVAGDPQ